MASSISKGEWIDLLREPFEQSMDSVHTAMTNHPAVQDWLQGDILESTMHVEAESNVPEASAAYSDMINSLEERFPALLEAVEELTQGCGQVDIDWRPLSPQLTGLFVNFNRDVEVDLFVGLDEASPEDVDDALDRLVDKLPRSEPFPNRPNEVTGIFAFGQACMAIRAREHNVSPGQRKKTFAVITRNADPSGQLSREDVLQRILDAFSEKQSR